MREPVFQPVALGEWIIDPLHNTLRNSTLAPAAALQEPPLKVEKRLIRVLLALAHAPQQTCSKQQLLEQVWSGKVVSDDTLSVAISNLRKILGCDAKQPRYIETITGYGFRLLPEVRLQTHAHTALDSAEIPAHLAAPGVHPIAVSRPIMVLALFGLAVICALALLLARPDLPSKSTGMTESAGQLLDNDVYQKARFLLQQDSLAELQEAEVLLKNLHQAQPANPLILNEYAKAIFYQAAYLPPAEKARAYDQAKRYFQRVVQLDAALGDAYLQLALLAIVYDRQLQQAQEYFIQSIALNPAEIVSHLRYAELLLARRDFNQAAQQNKIAQSLDPHYYASASIAWVYNMAGQYAEAKQELAKLYSLQPDSLLYHSSALRLYENMGDEVGAFKHYLLAFAAAGYSAAELAEARAMFAQGGLRKLNHWLATSQNEQRDIGQYHPPVSTARYLVAAGDLERALDYLEQAYTQDEYLLLWLNSDPKYQPLQGHPRFTRLLHNLGLQ